MTGPQTKLTLQSVTETSDGLGGVTESWQNVRIVSGVFVSNRGNETLSIGNKTVFATHFFFCDYSKSVTITEKNRFILGTRTFDILFVDDIGNQNIDLKIYLDEVKR